MSTRLTQVLRAGQAHGVSVLDDDALRMITRAIGDDDNAEAACLAARNWCSLNPRHRAMCKGGGDALWMELTRRIFGAPNVASKGLTSEEHFYHLCKMRIRANVAKRWMREHHFDPSFENQSAEEAPLLSNLGEALQLIRNGGFKTSPKRLRLVELVSAIFHIYPDDFRPAKILDVNELYNMVKSGQDAEIDAALELLDSVANDYVSVRPWYDEVHDGRDGFDPANVTVLKRLLEADETGQRAKHIVSIWKGLTSKVKDTEYAVHGHEVGMYARALLRMDVDKVLMHDYVVNGYVTGLTTNSLAILENIPRRINESLFAAMP